MENVRKNPWLGLKAYQEGEVLYGRDEDIRNLSQRIFNDIDTVLYGRSGIGKSSIINAGIIPTARRLGVQPVYVRLNHSSSEPYIKQIHEAFIQEKIEVRNIVPCQGKHELLWEFFHCNEFYNSEGRRIKILIVFDQFEEIFTLQQKSSQKLDFFNEMADVLNDIMPSSIKQEQSAFEPEEDNPVSEADDFDLNLDDIDITLESQVQYVYDNGIHIVFTLREDFLSEFEFHTASIPSLKQHRYGLRPINEEQAREIILRPVPGLITEDVARLIIEKITNRTDFSFDGKPEIEIDSAVLSLYLNRLFEEKTGDCITANLIEDKGGAIIENFYADCCDDVPVKVIESLEDQLLNEEGRRENKSLRIICRELGDENIEVLIAKSLLRVFAYAGDYRVEFIHDILCPVIKGRKEHRAQMRLLAEEERKRKEIERKAAEEKKRLEEEALDIKKANRRKMVSGILLVGFVAFIFFLSWLEKYNANERLHIEYYADYENIKGWPVGIGEPLTEEERLSTPLYYCLSHKGNKNGQRHTDVEVMSSNKYLPNRCRINKLEWAETSHNDRKARSYNNILSQVTKVRYSSVEGSNDISKEELINKDGDILAIISYFHLSANDAWMQFYTSKGDNLKIRDNGIDRAKMAWDTLGNITSIMYYDARRVPKEISEDSNVYGYLWDRSRQDTTFRYALNEVGFLSGIDLNTTVYINNESTEVTHYMHSSKVGAHVSDAVCESGYSRIVTRGDSTWLYTPASDSPCALQVSQRDRAGNIVQISTHGDNILNEAPIIRYAYHNGLVRKTERLTDDEKPFGESSESTYMHEYEYDDNGRAIEVRQTSVSGKLSFHFKTTESRSDGYTVNIKELMNIYNEPQYVKQIDTIAQEYSSTTYYEKNGGRLNYSVPAMQKSTQDVHRIIVRKSGNTVVMEHYAYDGNKVLPLETYSDKAGIVYSCFRRTEEYDDMGNMTSMKLEDSNGRILKSMMYFVQNGQIIGRSVRGIDGTPVRCAEWEEEGYMYYKFYYAKDNDDQYCGFRVVDEWDNNSAFYDPASADMKYQTVSRFDFKDQWVTVAAAESFEEFETRIFSTYSQMVFRSDANIVDIEIPYIHVLSHESLMYDNRQGIVDGDRIIRLGKWKLGDPVCLLDKEWKAALASGRCDIIILRPHDAGYEKKEMALRCGKNENQHIEYHVMKLTKSEHDFMKKFI